MARNGKRALGVDLNLKALRIAKGLRRRENDAVQKNVDFVCARLTELPFSDQSLGGGFVIDVLEHFYQKDIPLFFSEVKRVLKPGSRLQIITPFEHAYDDGLQHVTFFDLASLTRLLNDSGMKIIKIERDRRSDVYTPQGHDRINALIEIV
jgi:ubiquinone/menaquinone biosynthesis C-methylase UbiE